MSKLVQLYSDPSLKADIEVLNLVQNVDLNEVKNILQNPNLHKELTEKYKTPDGLIKDMCDWLVGALSDPDWWMNFEGLFNPEYPETDPELKGDVKDGVVYWNWNAAILYLSDVWRDDVEDHLGYQPQYEQYFEEHTLGIGGLGNICFDLVKLIDFFNYLNN